MRYLSNLWHGRRKSLEEPVDFEQAERLLQELQPAHVEIEARFSNGARHGEKTDSARAIEHLGTFYAPGEFYGGTLTFDGTHSVYSENSGLINL